MKVKISKVSIQEGPLYTMMGEDSPIVVYDVHIEALSGDIIYRHEYTFMGYFCDEDGCPRPNMAQRSEAERLVKRIEAAGEINLKYWTEVGHIPGGKKHDKYEMVNPSFFIE